MDGTATGRLRMIGWALRAVVLSALGLALFIVTVTAAALVVVWVGIPFLVWSIGLTRRLAEHRRRCVASLLGTPVGSPYLRVPEGSLLVRVRALAADPATRRDVRWLLFDGSLGLALAVVALVENVVGLVFWWLPQRLTSFAAARLDRALLDVSEKSRLALRVQELTESRAETVDTQAAELRRIERDLHDGAQARLVSLGMSLALAEQQLDSDPGGARALLAEARVSSSDALAELRDLVRGIHPPVLADRGLDGAVQALALAAPLPVTVRIEVPDRLPAPVESAAYFAVAEVLTNAVKHANASRAGIVIIHRDGALHLTVHDDGTGGADAAGGTGLRGIERRLSAFDGTLTISSPPGGPTELAMVLPCPNVPSDSGSSSRRISPSSATG